MTDPAMEAAYARDRETRALILTAVAALQDLGDRYRDRIVLPAIEDCVSCLEQEAAQLVRRWD